MGELEQANNSHSKKVSVQRLPDTKMQESIQDTKSEVTAIVPSFHSLSLTQTHQGKVEIKSRNMSVER